MMIDSSRKTAYQRCLLTFFLLFFTSSLSAQSTVPFNYMQYLGNLTPINPAYSRIDQAGVVTGVVRKQLMGIDGAPSTYVFDLSIPLPEMGASTGFIVQNDQVAIEKQTEINAFFAKSI